LEIWGDSDSGVIAQSKYNDDCLMAVIYKVLKIYKDPKDWQVDLLKWKRPIQN